MTDFEAVFSLMADKAKDRPAKVEWPPPLQFDVPPVESEERLSRMSHDWLTATDCAEMWDTSRQAAYEWMKHRTDIERRRVRLRSGHEGFEYRRKPENDERQASHDCLFNNLSVKQQALHWNNEQNSAATIE